jgi:hypothetical protein
VDKCMFWMYEMLQRTKVAEFQRIFLKFIELWFENHQLNVLQRSSSTLDRCCLSSQNSMSASSCMC